MNSKLQHYMTQYQNHVSVPLRGKDSHEHFSIYHTRVSLLSFPSPCGEKIVMNYVNKLNTATHLVCFRPLAGKR